MCFVEFFSSHLQGKHQTREPFLNLVIRIKTILNTFVQKHLIITDIIRSEKCIFICKIGNQI